MLNSPMDVYGNNGANSLTATFNDVISGANTIAFYNGNLPDFRWQDGYRALAVSFFGPDAGGVVLYKINGTRLVGQWSAPVTNGKVFEETLTRVADTPPSAAPPPSSTPSKPRPSDSRPLGRSSRPI